MHVDDLLNNTSLPDVSVDTDDALARTRRRGVRRQRRRTTLAGLGAVAIVAAGVVTAVQFAGDEPGRVSTGGPDRSEPTTPPTEVPPTSEITTPTSGQLGLPPSTGCTREAVAGAVGYELDEVLSDPVCNAGWGWIDACPASEESSEGCIHAGKVIHVVGDRWTIAGALLQDCAENFTAYGAPPEVAESFYPPCFEDLPPSG